MHYTGGTPFLIAEEALVARTKSRGIALIPLAVSLAAGPALADALAYVEASSELDGGRPASYAYNLVDGKETTTWCSRKEPAGEELVFGFLDAVQVTEIGIVVGALKKDGLDKRRQRVKELRLSDGKTERVIRFKDEPGLQLVRLDPPPKGRRLIAEIKSTYPADAEDAPVCVGELQLKRGSRSLTSSDALGKKVRALNTPSRRLLHMWIDEPSAAERTLVFALDGTFRYQYEPLLDGKPVRLKGRWTAGHRSITLEVRGKKHTLKTQLSRIDDGEQQTEQLTLVGDAPHPSLLVDFRPAPSRYE